MAATLYRTLLIGFIAAILGFTLFPAIDVGTSALFYRAGEGFALANHDWIDILRRLHMRLAWVAGILAFVLWVVLKLRLQGRSAGLLAWLLDEGGGAGLRIHGWLKALGSRLARWGILDIPPRKPLYVLLCLALGPGLLVNSILKDNWGRARPTQTVEFGGTQQFTPALTISDQCQRNCSFVSGEVSLGFWWMSLAFVSVAPWRRRIALASVTCGTLFALIRIGEGGHFLSDAVFSALLTLSVCAVLADLMAVGRAPPPGNRGAAVGAAPGPV